MLYHVSKDLVLGEKRFIPRVPHYRIYDEDSVIKRVCVSDSIKNCLTSFPYKNDLRHLLISQPLVFLNVYVLDEKCFEPNHIKYPHELSENVADAEKNNEHWILKEFTAEPYIIKLKKFELSMRCKYTNHFSGDVTELEYEKDTETYDRIEKMIFYNKNIFKLFKKACIESGINIIGLTKNYEHLDYFGGCMESSRKYPAFRVTYEIPANVSAKNIWVIINQEFYKWRRKYLAYDKKDLQL